VAQARKGARICLDRLALRVRARVASGRSNGESGSSAPAAGGAARRRRRRHGMVAGAGVARLASRRRRADAQAERLAVALAPLPKRTERPRPG
jgi:hypothetical protein